MAVQAIIEPLESLQLVGAAEGVDQIVELVARERPEVVVLDWMMPRGGGPEAARRILARNADTRIVGLTSSDSPEASLEMLRAGAICFLVKGGSGDELARTIHQAIDE
jgi:DNA-binding NarL/FixJ family response regulator